MKRDLVAGRYRLVEECSTTSMSQVFLAEDQVLERRVALKLLGTDADPARFEREARAAAGLAHPNIVQVFDYGRHADRPYIVLEYLEGGTLENRLVPGEAMADEETLRVAREVAAALAHAHECGVVHRDLKAGNVLFDAEGRAKVGDFGIAHVVGADTLTAAGTILGTAAYISPEQVSGAGATPASDVYSFGVLLYRMLTGRMPFESERPLELAHMHQTTEPAPVQSLRRGAPPALAGLAMSALAKPPDARPADGRSLVAALGEPPPPTALDGAPTAVLPAPGRRRRVSRLRLALGALLLAAIGVAAAVLVTGRHASAPASELTTGGAGRTGSHTASTAASTVPTTSSPTTTGRTTRPTTGTTPTTTRVTTAGTQTGPAAPPPPPATTAETTTAAQTTVETTTSDTTTP